LAWRAWAAFHIPGHTNGAAWDGPALAASGPYRLSRHPLYLANLMTIAALLLYAHCLPIWGTLLSLAGAALHHEALARAEEGFLLDRMGAAYRGYMDVTPRWPWFRRPSVPSPPVVAARTDWREAWARQAGNLAKACAGAALIWILAAGSR
jgi:protein-S-isoprenylcysteine O-methyltransferase Ste14